MKFLDLRERRRAFTLIELLIVVAIIAILAAIAVPNFLEAQTRSKVSRTLADIRSMRTALESYRVDNNAYPETDFGIVEVNNGVLGPLRMTTPISYITSLPTSPWNEVFGTAGAEKIATELNSYLYIRAKHSPGLSTDEDGDNNVDDNYEADRSQYLIMGALIAPQAREAIETSGAWEMKSVGPNNVDDRDSTNPKAVQPARIYDPTNGTISAGDILVFSDKPASFK
jgi:type II secretion system protein G